MGDMADYYKEQDIGAFDDEYLIDRESLWKTKDERRVAIKDMDDHHLLATIRVLRNMSPVKTRVKMDAVRRMQWSNAMANEAYARGLRIDETTDKEPRHE